jgi:hypothetical protein
VLFYGMRQARTAVHWTIQDFGEERLSGLPSRVVATVVGCA